MNVKDCIRLMMELFFSKFYILQGGLSQVIDGLVKHLTICPNVKMYLNEEVVSIKKGLVVTNKRSYPIPFCICALPKQVLETFQISIPIRHKLKHIHCAPLCRIYASFSKKWYKGPKLRCPSPLRMIIPGKTLMISYSDHKYALFWKQVYDTYGVPGVNRALAHFIKEALNINMPPPTSTNVHFWEYGVSYWTKNADSERLSNYFQEPLPQFYLCSDAYCSEFQQWMEGGLCMADDACCRIMARRPEPRVQS
jgi:hypothetical protein